ncbi:hypothetical protein ACU686_21750 [Yinghuangia aomiensis]
MPYEDDRLAAYLVPAATARSTDLEHEQVGTWRATYDALPLGPARHPAPTADDFTGWNGSYDGAPLPLDDMRAWRDGTVARILALRPRRVLEIGVGPGLLLSASPRAASATWPRTSPPRPSTR